MSIRKSKEVAALVVNLEQERSTISLLKLLILGVLGGMFLSFGALLYATVTTDIETNFNFGFAALIGGLVFSIGFILVMVSGTQLFVADFGIIAALEKKIPWANTAIRWLVVFGGNILGTILISIIYYNSGLYELSGDAVGGTIIDLADDMCELVWLTSLTRGVLAGIMLGLGVWMYHSAETTGGKVLSCILPTTTIMACGFEYSITNIFIIPLGITLHDLGVGGASSSLELVTGIVNNIVFVSIGNLIGAIIILGVLYWYVFKRN